MAVASPEKDYGASFFENSSEKQNIYAKNFRSDRGATRSTLLVESGTGNHYNYVIGEDDGEPNEQRTQGERKYRLRR
jgi:hypothetical protein